MSLQAKLDAFKQSFEPKLPEDVLATMRGATQDLRASGILNDAVKVGDTLPSFSLANQDAQVISSSDLMAKGPLVISLFRGAWCPYCMIELNALSDVASDVRSLGGNIVVISPQTADKSKAMHDKEGLDLPVLSDPGTGYAKDLGLSFVLPQTLRDIYGKLGGFRLPDYNGDDSWRLPIPARLIVDQDSIVRYAEIDADYTVRPEPSETLAALRAL